MPQMYKMRSSDFCTCGWWKKGTPGAVRGTSTATCTDGGQWARQLVFDAADELGQLLPCCVCSLACCCCTPRAALHNCCRAPAAAPPAPPPIAPPRWPPCHSSQAPCRDTLAACEPGSANNTAGRVTGPGQASSSPILCKACPYAAAACLLLSKRAAPLQYLVAPLAVGRQVAQQQAPAGGAQRGRDAAPAQLTQRIQVHNLAGMQVSCRRGWRTMRLQLLSIGSCRACTTPLPEAASAQGQRKKASMWHTSQVAHLLA